MKRICLLLVLAMVLNSVAFEASAQRRPAKRARSSAVRWERDIDGKPILCITLEQITVFGSKRDFRQYERMVRAVKKVYPLAKEAAIRMETITVNLEEMKRKDRRVYTADVEEALKREITPMLWKMTRFEGVILLKLIDRETKYTAFNIIKLYRSGFVAGFYQALARLFGNNLKLEYDPKGEDAMLEQIVRYYEAGLL